MSESRFSYEGYELIITPDEPGYKGECEKLEYYTCDSDMGSLITQFKSFIDNKKEKQLSEKQLKELESNIHLFEQVKRRNFMIPQYSASITCTLGTTLEIYFSHVVTPELYHTLYSLGEYAGILVNEKGSDEFCITLRPVWAMETVVEEVISILVSEGFERDSILVK